MSARAASFEQQIASLRAEIHRLLKQGTYSPALSKVKRYVFLVKRKYGNRHPRYADALNLKAKVYTKLNRRFEAKRFSAKATRILRNHKKDKARHKAEMQKRLAALRKQKAETRARLLLKHQTLAKQKREKARRQAALEKRRAARAQENNEHASA